MSNLVIPDKKQLEKWLSRAGFEHYTCDQCAGLHLSSLQELEGVVDSRLFVEPWGLLLSTELEIRPSALLVLSADLGRLHMDYPTLKLFLDVVDDGMPQLVVGATELTGAGLDEEQFRLFVATAADATRQLAAESLHLDYVLPAEGVEQSPKQPHVH
jgi:hypothetical protein